ncbi:MAG: DUF456 family protein [Muribaculaceae bacterium]|nr:DUF456 family protein [Muribaculaceae bacterium]
MTVLIIIAVILLSSAAIVSFRPAMPPALPAYAGLWVLDFSGLVNPETSLMIFWGIATVIAVIIGLMMPMRRGSLRGGYTSVAVGTFIGMLAGIYTYPGAGIVVGAFAGALIGYILYRRSPRGNRDRSPFLSSFCGIGLPTIVTFCIIGVALQLIIDASDVVIFRPLITYFISSPV